MAITRTSQSLRPAMNCGDNIVTVCASAKTQIQGNAPGSFTRLPDIGFARSEHTVSVRDGISMEQHARARVRCRGIECRRLLDADCIHDDLPVAVVERQENRNFGFPGDRFRLIVNDEILAARLNCAGNASDELAITIDIEVGRPRALPRFIGGCGVIRRIDQRRSKYDPVRVRAKAERDSGCRQRPPRRRLWPFAAPFRGNTNWLHTISAGFPRGNIDPFEAVIIVIDPLQRISARPLGGLAHGG
jgi:hypothetical protein